MGNTYQYKITIYEYDDNEKSTRDIEIETNDKTIVIDILKEIKNPWYNEPFKINPVPIQPMTPMNPWSPWTTPNNPMGPIWTGTSVTISNKDNKETVSVYNNGPVTPTTQFVIDDVINMLQKSELAGKDKNEESEFEKHKCKVGLHFGDPFKGGY